METENLFTGTRWDILKTISQSPSSPLEIAGKLNTSVANVSQQLRLLEMSGLIKSKKTSMVEKGKPRVIYALARDVAHLIFLADKIGERKTLVLDDYHKAILKIWFLLEPEYHTYYESFFWKISDYLKFIEYIVVNKGSDENEVILVSKDLDKIKGIKGVDIRKDSGLFKIKLTTITSGQFSKDKFKESNYVVIYRSPGSFMEEVNEKKGVEENGRI